MPIINGLGVCLYRKNLMKKENILISFFVFCVAENASHARKHKKELKHIVYESKNYFDVLDNDKNQVDDTNFAENEESEKETQSEMFSEADKEDIISQDSTADSDDFDICDSDTLRAFPNETSAVNALKKSINSKDLRKSDINEMQKSIEYLSCSPNVMVNPTNANEKESGSVLNRVMSTAKSIIGSAKKGFALASDYTTKAFRKFLPDDFVAIERAKQAIKNRRYRDLIPVLAYAWLRYNQATIQGPVAFLRDSATKFDQKMAEGKINPERIYKIYNKLYAFK